MQIIIDFHQQIYEQLGEEAARKGLTFEEIVRVIVGEHTQFSGSRAIPLPSIYAPAPTAVQDTSEKMVKMAEILMRRMVADGSMKCPNCTMPMKMESLETSKCDACGLEI